MKYISVNRLSDFEFHDARIAFDSFVNNQLTVIVYHLNIHKNAEQNPFETDMEIESAYITFEGTDIISYEPGRTWQKDENERFYSTEPQVIFSDDAHYRFLEQLKTEITILDFDIKEGKTYFIDAMSADTFFTVCFTFESVVIAWDSYKKEAWYTSWKG
ncbi:MAG: hypothetical protein ACI3VK_02315 [Oscillospiraceae bacterium]